MPRSAGDKAGQKRHRHERVLPSLRRSAPFIYAAMVAIVTLLPSASATKVKFFANQAIDFHVAFSYISILILPVFLVMAASKLKICVKFSWPLLTVVASYIAIMILLILEGLNNTVSDGWAYGGPMWLDDLAGSLDVHHAIIYAVFTVTAAIGWRDRIILPVLAVILITYGAVLEVWQEEVPGRSFRIADVVSNCIGVVIGLVGVHLMDTLSERGAKRSPASTSRRRWKQT